jgi:hypothetical protein
MSHVRNTVVGALLTATLALLLTESAWAVPSYSRRYGVDCSTCHTVWGALTGAGVTFRLSGYRAINGRELKPISEDIELGNGALTIPTTLPFSFVTGVGYDWRSEERTSNGNPVGGALPAGTKTTQKASSLALEDASIFLTGSFGKHLSGFIEFPMYETKAWEFTPTGPAEANSASGSSATGGRQFQFVAENPAFEVAKFWWNDLVGDNNSMNLLGGITHLPLAYPSGKVRLSVNQFLIYERRALDLISPRGVSGSIGSADESLFRLGEPQIFVELNGILTFGKALTDTGKRETFWNEYHIGVSNGSNGKPDNNTTKDLYGRYVMRWYNQSLGVFGYTSADTYDDLFRTSNTVGVGGSLGIMSGAQSANKMTRTGLDFTLSLAPFGIPVSLDNQFMWNSESNPTGFDQAFKWRGGFDQLNWLVSRNDVLYARYDWIKGDSFNDTNSNVNGNTGQTAATPQEYDIVAGYQHLIQQNVKFILELRRHEFKDTSAPTTAKLADTGGTARFMIGF